MRLEGRTEELSRRIVPGCSASSASQLEACCASEGAVMTNWNMEPSCAASSGRNVLRIASLCILPAREWLVCIGSTHGIPIHSCGPACRSRTDRLFFAIDTRQRLDATFGPQGIYANHTILWNNAVESQWVGFAAFKNATTFEWRSSSRA